MDLLLEKGGTPCMMRARLCKSDSMDCIVTFEAMAEFCKPVILVLKSACTKDEN